MWFNERWALVLCLGLLLTDCRDQASEQIPPVGALDVTMLANSTSVYHVGSVIHAVSPEGVTVWQVRLPNDAPVIAAKAAAPNSFVYVRTRDAVHAVTHAGVLLWSHALPGAPAELPAELLAPVALADSGVALLETTTKLRCIGVDGTVRYTVMLPDGYPQGALVAADNGLVVITTTRGLYGVNPAGEIAWHHVPAQR